jgi:hypothetical protein
MAYSYHINGHTKLSLFTVAVAIAAISCVGVALYCSYHEHTKWTLSTMAVWDCYFALPQLVHTSLGIQTCPSPLWQSGTATAHCHISCAVVALYCSNHEHNVFPHHWGIQTCPSPRWQSGTATAHCHISCAVVALYCFIS